MSTRHLLSGSRLPWLLLLLLALLALLLIGTSWWRATGTGPQVQVPMFYDDHYVYPRAWTQAQEAPGVPDPAPVAALYGPNRISQPFVAGSDRLSLVEVWLAGAPGTAVHARLEGENGTAYSGTALLDDPEGRYYRFSFPAQVDAAGRRFWLTLSAPAATAAAPAITRAVGGDRLGASIHLNEYGRPGNLELYTYARGRPGTWWLAALGEQLLPALFRLRLQQYKPAPFKGAVFALLLLSTVLLSALFLFLARPRRRNAGAAAAWALLLLAGTFLLWQGGSGRLRLPLLTPAVPLATQTAASAIAPPAPGPRLVHDFALTLWTAAQEPEPRFISTAPAAGQAAIRVPARSALAYPLVVPPHGRLQGRLAVDGEGSLRFAVDLGGEEVYAETVAGGAPVELEVELGPWAGQATTLALRTEPVGGTPTGLWLSPRLDADHSWLRTALPPEAAPAGYTFGETVDLQAFTLARDERRVDVTLFWQAQAPPERYATVFVHLLDGDGQIVAQHDGQPVQNSYPLPAWTPALIVADTHPLTLPETLPPGPYTLAVGLYDPLTLDRWPVAGPEGEPGQDGRALLPLEALP